MGQIWEKFKWLWTHVLWWLAGLILLIDPRHIDELASQHPKWGAAILALWGALLAWANKPRPAAQSPPATAKSATRVNS